MTVSVNAPAATNSAPTADAGDDQTVNGGSRVRLYAGGSTDPDNHALTYSWMKSPSVDATITAESSEDTYLFLREVSLRRGTQEASNDDHSSSEFTLASNTDSGISHSLSAGITYTIEVTTYSSGITGDFTLTIGGLSSPVAPDTSADACVSAVSGNGAISGSWSNSCDSEGRTGRYASYYTFTPSTDTDVTITAESSEDTYLFLRKVAFRSATSVASNDDHSSFGLASSTDSGISHSLNAGTTYVIEVTTYDPGRTGDFTLTIGGLAGAVAPDTSGGCVYERGERERRHQRFLEQQL